jgi:glycosyltransferase involved in cell wall biosynthesis
MRIGIFDDVVGGHHPGYTNGITAGLLRAGIDPQVFTPEKPPALQGRGDWVPVLPATLRQVLRGRRNLNLAVNTCLTRRSLELWDLYLDKNIWVLPRRLNQIERRVHVLHHSTQYSFQNRTASGRLRTVLARRRLRALAAQGHLIVVHTQRAHDLLSSFLPHETIVRCGYPLVEPAAGYPDTGRRGTSGRLLFVGSARREKGLHLLLETLDLLNGAIPLDVVGRQDPETRGALEAQFKTAGVRWIDRYVDDVELAEYYRDAALVVAPYLSSFQTDGGASGILLESMAHGTPMVITPALEDQLPTAYGGAIVASEDEAKALGDALEAALDRSAALQAAALVEGPRFIREHHTFDQYVASILTAAGR